MQFVYLFVLCFLHQAVLISSSDVPIGHMLPLGSHIKATPVDEVFMENMISPKEFFDNYVMPRKPVVFRGVGKSWSGFDKFTEEYLKEKYGDIQLRMEGKKEKQTRIPVGDIGLGRDTLRNFLRTYHGAGSSKYIVSELPKPMYPEVNVIPPMTCGPFKDHLVEIDLWINGGNASSILHKDAFNTLNCVVNGTKDWKLVAIDHNDLIYQAWESKHEAGYGGFSLINPDKVDMIKYPNIGKIPEWQHVVVEKGDCLHLPSQMWHHVKSSGAMNLAVAFLFSRFDDEAKINVDFGDCPQTPDTKSLDNFEVDWEYPGHGELTMGYMELTGHRESLYQVLDKNGQISKKKLMYVVDENFEGKPDEYILERFKNLYEILIRHNVSRDTIPNLSKKQLREIGFAVEQQDPSNTIDFEYSYISSHEIRHHIEDAFENNNDLPMSIQEFLHIYRTQIQGSRLFGKRLFDELEGNERKGLTLDNYKENIDKAMEKYDWYTLGEGEDEDDDDESRFLYKVESKEKSPDFTMDTDREYLRNTRKTKVKSEANIKTEL